MINADYVLTDPATGEQKLIDFEDEKKMYEFALFTVDIASKLFLLHQPCLL